eukprot:5870629-Amphidinium_carterae.2
MVGDVLAEHSKKNKSFRPAPTGVENPRVETDNNDLGCVRWVRMPKLSGLVRAVCFVVLLVSAPLGPSV